MINLHQISNMLLKQLLSLLILSISGFCVSAQVMNPPLGTTSTPIGAEIKLTLIAKIQSNYARRSDSYDFYDRDVVSPKSAIFLESKGKFYVNNLEGQNTTVYQLGTFKKLATIPHSFTEKDAGLFMENTSLNYDFIEPRDNPNIFSGKPVECCLSHNGKYLWVTYYRRSYDPNAMEPSALAIIDTELDKIVRVMPTGPLPKMIACSPDNKYIAVTHWGDNTVGIIDVSSGDYRKFKFVKQLIVEHQMRFSAGDKARAVNRDSQCGYCLRGTAFTADSRYLLVGRMGGGGISVFDMKTFELVRTVYGMKSSVRHLIVTKNNLYLSTNTAGYVQKTSISDFIKFATSDTAKSATYNKWMECHVGSGARTIEVSEDEKYLYVAVNNESKVVVVRCADMKIVAQSVCNSYPVGLAIRKKGFLLIVTSQAHPGVGGGNTVSIFYVKQNKK